MGTIKPIIVSYDISKNKVRTKIRKIISEWRLDGQKSVHECLLDKSQAEELFLQLSEHLNKKTDLLLMAWLEPHRSVLTRGLGNNRISGNILHVR